MFCIIFFQGSARVAYDASVGKIAADVSYYHNGKPGQMKLIQDYSKVHLYLIVICIIYNILGYTNITLLAVR